MNAIDLSKETGKVLGMSVSELLEIKRKLMLTGINLVDLIEFIDRDKVQLFAELKQENNALKAQVERIKQTVYNA